MLDRKTKQPTEEPSDRHAGNHLPPETVTLRGSPQPSVYLVLSNFLVCIRKSVPNYKSGAWIRVGGGEDFRRISVKGHTRQDLHPHIEHVSRVSLIHQPSHTRAVTNKKGSASAWPRRFRRFPSSNSLTVYPFVVFNAHASVIQRKLAANTFTL